MAVDCLLASIEDKTCGRVDMECKFAVRKEDLSTEEQIEEQLNWTGVKRSIEQEELSEERLRREVVW